MREGVLYYHEIFTSIQGEGLDAGKLCTFVRLHGCDMKCSYCDQPQKPSDRKRTSVDSVVKKVIAAHVPNVCITGGEPLLQWESVYQLILTLVAQGFNVSVETSGCHRIEADPYNRSFKYIMDVKCPSSGMTKHNVLDNIMNLQVKDEVVFVIQNLGDYVYAKKILKEYPTSATILFSPCFNKDDEPMIGSKLVEWMIEDGLVNVRLSVQMHKVIGVL